MYIDFTSKNLAEFYKIVQVLDTCEYPTQFDIVKNMARQFGKNCDFRQSKLKKIAYKKLLKFSVQGFDDYFKYKESTSNQVQTIIDKCNLWLTEYDNWVTEQKAKEESNKLKANSKISIIGFQKLFKKKNQKKKES